uniref:Major facilitator superfamily (MFS) profile domain-containing protein n=1 Tax=Meloidogyne incognita TaxID=6306 RepID=A0A914L769_MELIC
MEERCTGNLFFAALAASIGLVQFGYNIGCINMPADLIKEWFVESYNKGLEKHQKRMTIADMETEWSVAVSIFAVGGIVGGLFCGYFADKFGRKTALILNNVIALIATVFFVLAKLFDVRYLFTAGRLIIGVNAGLNTGLVPMYLTEVSPVNIRGTIGSLPQFFATTSIVVSQLVGLPPLLGTAERWPWIFYGISVPAMLQIFALFFCPESPMYNLLTNNNKSKAEKDLIKLRGHKNVNDELKSIKKGEKSAPARADISYTTMFDSKLFWPLALSTFMIISQQLSGINAVLSSSKDLFKNVGLTNQW